ncbi:precorrin-8X methylmutase [Romeria aff. gracilis LEGE 07310]|uniref:Precorrin-8X methylmutase n=1 Tax=Vasconcelosia minhoensis LEGE 07310 TaxID=915328 RepID=A0A8J7AUJ6_9CYAN|nr:precorrin-8X methylmutase [Romeria gracilis]MBE9077013.1 precorrin-8X methylmutase [Romeria aff. gracilis LEGE 07310]
MTQTFTIKQLSTAVGSVTPRMVRHYHQLGLLPPPQRSRSNYRLYTDADIQRLRRIVSLKQQGFQLAHIKQVLATESSPEPDLSAQLQRQYQSVVQQLVQLRQTATALEGLIGRDRACQSVQAEALAQLRRLEAESRAEQAITESLWHRLDAAVDNHPENFQEALQQLLPDLSQRSEIEVDLLSQLVLACGDVSLVSFVRLSHGAIKAARAALGAGCAVVGDVPMVTAALDQTRLAHLGCETLTLLDDPHIHSAAEAEASCWQVSDWQQRLSQLPRGCILIVGYAPSLLVRICDAIAYGMSNSSGDAARTLAAQLQPALVIGMPIGFSHAPAAKRRLMQLSVPSITIEGTAGGGLLGAVGLNALAASLIEKPDCHCYLKERTH